jgi:hypothetical protein
MREHVHPRGTLGAPLGDVIKPIQITPEIADDIARELRRTERADGSRVPSFTWVHPIPIRIRSQRYGNAHVAGEAQSMKYPEMVPPPAPPPVVWSRWKKTVIVVPGSAYIRGVWIEP